MIGGFYDGHAADVSHYVSEEAELNAFTAEQQGQDDSWVRLAGLDPELQ